MKKQLLFIVAAAIGISTQAQQSKMQNLNKATYTGNTKSLETKKQVFTGNEIIPVKNQVKSQPQTTKNLADLPEVKIATSTYDLQTNSSIANRFIRSASGEMIYVFTFSSEAAGGSYGDRGTGYVSNLSGTWDAEPTQRIETTRTGWPNIARTHMGEAIVSHNTVAEELEFMNRPTVGTGAWTESTTALASPITTGNWWPRMVSGGADGNSLHALSITYPVANGGTKYLGLDGALLYCRSTDGGQTWDKNQSQIPGMDSLKYNGFSGDSYSIDANGNNIAIVTGDLMEDIVLWRSTDNGDNWTSQVVYDLGVPEPYTFGPAISDTNDDGIADTIISSGGSLAVILDNDNKAHIFFDLVRVFDDTVSTEGLYTSFPYGNPGLAYWTENNPTEINVIGRIEDLNGNDTIDFYGDVDGDGYASEFGRYGNTGLVSMPSVSVDANNTLVVSYAAMVEKGEDDLLKAYRHTYLKKSTDGGLTWSNAVDIYSDLFSECVFASQARNSDEEVHLVYMRDPSPGHGVPPSSGTADPDNAGGDFFYIHPSVQTLQAGIKENRTTFNEIQIFPNPAIGNVSVQVSNKNADKLQVRLFDVVGKEVVAYVNTNTSASHNASIDISSLSSGLYLVKVEMNGESITRKLQVK